MTVGLRLVVREVLTGTTLLLLPKQGLGACQWAVVMSILLWGIIQQNPLSPYPTGLWWHSVQTIVRLTCGQRCFSAHFFPQGTDGAAQANWRETSKGTWLSPYFIAPGTGRPLQAANIGVCVPWNSAWFLHIFPKIYIIHKIYSERNRARQCLHLLHQASHYICVQYLQYVNTSSRIPFQTFQSCQRGCLSFLVFSVVQ